MKKCTIMLLIFWVLRETSHSSQDASVHEIDTCCSQANNSIFGEAGGNGISFSINYERFVSCNFGLRVGYGAFYGAGTSIPFMANFYVGQTYKLELGAGLVFLPLWNFDASFGKEKALVLTSTVGLRFQRSEGGVIVRLSLTPFFDPSRQQFKLFGGLSVGIAF